MSKALRERDYRKALTQRPVFFFSHDQEESSKRTLAIEEKLDSGAAPCSRSSL